MAKELITTVHVHGHGIYGPGDKLPAEVRKLLADNPRVWSDDDGPEAEQPDRPGPSETADAGDQVGAAVEAGQKQRDAEAAGTLEAEAEAAAAAAEAVASAAQQAGPGEGADAGQASEAPKSTRARRSGKSS